MTRSLPTMTFLNAYTPPPPPSPPPPLIHLDTPPDLYDHNFPGGPLFPLATDRCMLVPFVPSLHARAYFEGIKGRAEMLRFMPYAPDPSASLESLCEVIEVRIRRDPGTCLFAIFDLDRTTDEGLPSAHPPLSALAGVLGLLNVSRVNLIGEVGHIVLLPSAQRTHISSHAVALLQHFALDLHVMSEWDASSRSFCAPSSPDPSRPPLGLRRLQWQAHARNAPSIRAAQRLGFRPEGVQRSQRIVPVRPAPSNRGEDDARLEPGRKGDGAEMGSRDSWVGAITWRDWEEGVKDKVDELVAR